MTEDRNDKKITLKDLIVETIKTRKIKGYTSLTSYDYHETQEDRIFDSVFLEKAISDGTISRKELLEFGIGHSFSNGQSAFDFGLLTWEEWVDHRYREKEAIKDKLGLRSNESREEWCQKEEKLEQKYYQEHNAMQQARPGYLPITRSRQLEILTPSQSEYADDVKETLAEDLATWIMHNKKKTDSIMLSKFHASHYEGKITECDTIPKKRDKLTEILLRKDNQGVLSLNITLDYYSLIHHLEIWPIKKDPDSLSKFHIFLNFVHGSERDNLSGIVSCYPDLLSLLSVANYFKSIDYNIKLCLGETFSKDGIRITHYAR